MEGLVGVAGSGEIFDGLEDRDFEDGLLPLGGKKTTEDPVSWVAPPALSARRGIFEGVGGFGTAVVDLRFLFSSLTRSRVIPGKLIPVR